MLTPLPVASRWHCHRQRRLWRPLCLAMLSNLALAAFSGFRYGLAWVLMFKKKPEEPPPPPPTLLEQAAEFFTIFYNDYISILATWFTAFMIALIILSGFVVHKILQARVLRRPYEVLDEADKIASTIKDPASKMKEVVMFVQEAVLRPLDNRIPGQPFEFDFHSFPFTPTVLVIGNHSSGKSTFINSLLGKDEQDTGVAPTDDGFTVLERWETTELEDGPTILGCRDNRPFRDLQRFGQLFTGHLRRKRVKLADTAQMPFGLQIVDTPGMIDLPVNADESCTSIMGRGYNFLEVVRWWAKRSDLILLLFDPDKPGTTGETLNVMTKSLAGLHHKFLVVLNKVDQLDNCVDLARAYGTLGWALSKVIKQKDVPQFYTMFNSGFEGSRNSKKGDNSLPLQAFEAKRKEVVDEVLRAKERHNDNLVTSLGETLRQMEMLCTILERIRAVLTGRRLLIRFCSLGVIVPPAIMALLFEEHRLEAPSAGFLIFCIVSYVLVVLGVTLLLWESYRNLEKLQASNLDETFEHCYHRFFIHDDGEDHKARWAVVKPLVANTLRSLSCPSHLPRIKKWEIDHIQEVLSKDMWFLRQLAREAKAPFKLGMPPQMESVSKSGKETDIEPVQAKPATTKSKEARSKKDKDDYYW